MKLVEYMPPFLKNVVEFNKIFDAEDVEIESMRYLIDSILREVIVKSARTYGLDRYEKIYGITNKAETIEARRMNILFKMNNKVPYTLKWLINTLNESIGKDNYEIEKNFNEYKMKITTHLELPGQVDELDYILDYMIPANIDLTSENKIFLNMTDGTTRIASGIVFCNYIEITDNFKENLNINNDSKYAGGVTDTLTIEITDNFNETFNIKGENKIGSNVNLTEII